MLPVLQIRFLGEFSLTHDDVQLATVNTPRLQSLLAYLVLHRNAPQSRSHLAYLFWPGSPEAQAHTNLRHLIHLLRQALPDADRFLCVDTVAIQWRPAVPIMLDVAEFEGAIAEHRLADAVGLYHGDLLPYCYDDWIAPERERLQQMYIDVLDQLICQMEGVGNYRAALDYAQRLLRHDPLREDTYRLLMRLYAQRGDRTGIVRTYDTCVSVLRRELGIAPNIETREAYDQYRGAPASASHAVERVSPARLNAIPNNLPLHLTRFLGREHERDQVKRLVEAHRLVTLTGAGGVGKTRLALAVAEDILGAFDDGIWHVDLAPLSDPALAVQAVASVLGLREEGRQPLLAQLVDYVCKKRLLVILDNCEHLVGAVQPLVETLLHGAPDLRILVSSRMALGVAGEVIWQVPPLSVPDASSWTPHPPQTEGRSQDWSYWGLEQYASVKVFVDRAVAALPTFAITSENAVAIAWICQRLDGIPLAIELAAARVQLLAAQQIADRLDDALLLLAQNQPTPLPHHQTLRATMDWSYALLSGQEQTLFRRLATFAGSFSLESAEAIGSGNGIEPDQVLELLSGLVGQSLVAVEPAGEATRFRLHEITRQYAHARLAEAGELAWAHDRHWDYFCNLAEEIAPKLRGAGQPIWLRRLETEHCNLRAALDWCLDHHQLDRALRLVGALTRFWFWRGYLSEGRRAFAAALAQDAQRATQHTVDRLAPLRAQMLRGAGVIARAQGDLAEANQYLQESLALWQRLGRQAEIASVLGELGSVAYDESDCTRAKHLFESCLSASRAAGDEWCIAWALNGLGEVTRCLGDYAGARTFYEDSLSVHRKLGSEIGIAVLLHNLGHVVKHQGDHAQAAALFRESLGLAQKLGDRQGTAECLAGLAGVAAAQGAAVRAARLLGSACALLEGIGALLEPADRAEHDRAVAAARAALGEPGWAAAWAEGSALKLGQAIAYAMEQTSG